MPLRFHKYHVCGNDFVIISSPDCAGVVRRISDLGHRICDRRYGIGADELLILGPSEVADASLSVINPDGSCAPTCGNALLAATAFLGTRPTGDCRESSMTFMTARGLRRTAVLSDGTCTTTLGVPCILDWPLPPATLSPLGCTRSSVVVDSGTPHLIVFVRDIEKVQVEQVGPKLERYEGLPETTNVTIAQSLDSGRLRIRTWERGGTGRSMACGTGACAAAFAHRMYAEAAGRSYRVVCDGGPLDIAFDHAGAAVLGGKPSLLFEGLYLL